MAALVWIPLLAPLLAAGLLAARPGRIRIRGVEVWVAVIVLASGIGLLVAVTTGGPIRTGGGLLRADALSAYMLTTVGAVGTTALWGGATGAPSGGATGAGGGSPDPARDGRYGGLLALFLAAMSLAVLADNLGVLWVAVEATTITTAFLVGSHGSRTSLEAAWKYVLLGCVGVAIAFLGLVLLYAATRAAGSPTLSWNTLTSRPARLDPAVTRLAVALTVLGFATKAGLAPMHSWLPDAHSQAPAPVSGLMSGVLLSVAFYAILRIQAISNAVLGPGFMRVLLVTAGLLSLAVAAALIVAQRDYKRLLAYSSIEHMGLLALGAAAGSPLARAAVLLHILGHGLVKAVMFVLAGRLLTSVGSSRIGDVRDLLGRRPDLGVPFLVGTAALLGLPPFALFFTEVAILLGAWQQGLGWAAAVALALLLLIFAGFGRHVLAMTLRGGAPGAERTGAASDRLRTAHPPEPMTRPTSPVVPELAEIPELGADRGIAADRGIGEVPDVGEAPELREDPGIGPSRRRAAQAPVVAGLLAAAVLPFATWPMTGVLTDAVAALVAPR